MCPEDEAVEGQAHSFLHFCPLAEEIVINASQLNGCFFGSDVAFQLTAETLNGVVEVKHQGALAVVPEHALQPEEGANSSPPRDRGDVV